jgi:hypothetical protein
MKNIEQLFNTDPLLNELNNVIQSGLNKLLSDYTTNYKLYEETHNCIMNLPSVKREIAKKSELNEIYNDLPDLISISSDRNNLDNHTFENDYSKYIRVPTKYDSDDSSQESDDSGKESDDTILWMKKVANQLLKEKEEITAFYQEEKKSYKEIIETRNKEIDELKDKINILFEENNKRYELFYKQQELYENAIKKYNKEIDDLTNQLNSCVKQPLVCDLTSDNNDSDQEVIDEPCEEPDQTVIEIKEEKEKEKENIVLHIEEAETDIDQESDEEDEEVEDEEVEDEEVEDEASEEEDEEVQEEDEEVQEEEVVEDEASEEVQEEEVVEDEASEEVQEEDEASEAVETEKSDSDEESQEELEEKDEIVEEDNEEELIEIEIDGVTYCTENEDNGFIYELDSDGNVGETVGYLKEGEPFFN